MEIFSSKPNPLHGDLLTANIVVAAGRGLGSYENFLHMVELASLLDAQVAGTRGAVACGWLSREREVGLSGCRVRPQLYLACGLSGANFHTIGMEYAHCIVAVNTDPKARIFQLAHIPILTDVNFFIKQVTAHLTATRFQPHASGAIEALRVYLVSHQTDPSLFPQFPTEENRPL